MHFQTINESVQQSPNAPPAAVNFSGAANLTKHAAVSCSFQPQSSATYVVSVNKLSRYDPVPAAGPFRIVCESVPRGRWQPVHVRFGGESGEIWGKMMVFSGRRESVFERNSRPVKIASCVAVTWTGEGESEAFRHNLENLLSLVVFTAGFCSFCSKNGPH